MKKKAYDAISLLDEAIGDNPERRKLLAVEALNDAVAQIVYDAREAAGMNPVPEDLDYRDITLTQLAELLWEVGASVTLTLAPLDQLSRNEQLAETAKAQAQRRRAG